MCVCTGVCAGVCRCVQACAQGCVHMCVHMCVQVCVHRGVQMCRCVCRGVCRCVQMCRCVCTRVCRRQPPACLRAVLQQQRGRRQRWQRQGQAGLSRGRWCRGLVKHPDRRQRWRRGLPGPWSCLGWGPMPLVPPQGPEQQAPAPQRAAGSHLPGQVKVSPVVRGEGWGHLGSPQGRAGREGGIPSARCALPSPES